MKTKKKRCCRRLYTDPGIRAARKTPEPNNRTQHGYDEREVVSALEILNFEQPAGRLTFDGRDLPQTHPN